MSTPTKAARGTSGDAGSSPATSTTRRTVLAALAALLVGAAAGVAGSALAHRDAEAQFLHGAAIEHQPGYEGAILAAGHWSCAALHFGMTEPELVDYGAREGLAGDLYTRDSVGRIVHSAHETLCPAAPLPGQIHP